MSLTVSGSGESVQPDVPETAKQHTEAHEQIRKCLENSLGDLLATGKESKMISGDRLKQLSKESIHEFSEKIAAIAVAQGIQPAEFEEIIKDEALDVEAFLDNEALFEIYEKTISEALENYEKLKNANTPSIDRVTVLKLVAIAISRGIIGGKGGVVAIGETSFYARVKKKQKKVYVISLDNMKKLGSGGSSKAYDVMELVRGGKIVFKYLREAHHDDESTISGIQKSYKILKGVHAEGKKVGIQAVPHATFGIVPGVTAVPKEEFLVGLIDVYYEKTLDSFMASLEENAFSAKGEDTLKDRLHIAAQLLEGLATLHEMGITHGDIKEENVLLKRSVDRELIADISDFDDAKTKDEVGVMPPPEINPLGSYTPACVLKSDLREEYKALKAGDADLTLARRKKRDVFAMGACLYRLLTGLEPYGLDKEDYPQYDSAALRKGLIQGPYVRPFTYEQKSLNYELLLHMLMPRQDQRYSANDALSKFRQLMETFTQTPHF